MSLSSDTSHPGQGPSPKEAGLNNGGVGVYFSQLQLDDKGQYQNVLSCVVAKTNSKA